MKFNLNKFLISCSFLLDFIEIDILDNITNHCKRVGYISLKIGESFHLSEKEKFNLLAFAILHDIGGVENKKKVSKDELEQAKEHCIIGERSIRNFPFFFDQHKNIILYHHENYDGSGFFQKEKDEIPLFSQIISIADYCELIYSSDKSREEIILEIKKEQGKKFSEDMVKKFMEISQRESFWLNLKDEFILSAVEAESPKFNLDCSYQQLNEVTTLFSDIIDSKSQFTKRHSAGLSKKAEIMAEFYNFRPEKKYKFIIAANLHDLGKLAISNSILDKPGKLTKEEFYKMKAHTFYTRKVLERIDGFDEITEWAANHHEKLDGSGYPYGFDKDDLDFPSQIMMALDIYQALREDRPYRTTMSHAKAMGILNTLVPAGKLNLKIVSDIAKVFKP
ncbi:HD-GYP domain-containing protein [Orenia marismortui]|uniref:HD-GYP domain-containing protein (C-di-GMP phosphodiesterase class II) n=1 Tax=Orenia marismortui TaxID=46469 RepID=A0A4R8GNW6_9FIRM|nr:HD domain-containing phosphohydrolase [Orenia marismortui]TDX46348.1 HD-GYP domain-containing protein (c-di-GMP phosphodiesterase class II) [Orenia marismortui]